MFDFGFSEVLLTSVIALIVLGPEKLPKAASQVGRWVGRARAMARQFREQLEEEVNLETVKKAHKEEEARREAEAKKAAASGGAGDANAGDGQGQSSGAAGGGTGAADGPGQGSMAADGTGTDGGQGESPYVQPAATPNLPQVPDTFSHAHPTNEFGANPLTPDGAAESPAPPAEGPAQNAGAGTTAHAEAHAAPPDPAMTSEPPHRPESSEAYASIGAPASETPAATHSPNPPEKSGPA